MDQYRRSGCRWHAASWAATTAAPPTAGRTASIPRRLESQALTAACPDSGWAGLVGEQQRTSSCFRVRSRSRGGSDVSTSAAAFRKGGWSVT